MASRDRGAPVLNAVPAVDSSKTETPPRCQATPEAWRLLVVSNVRLFQDGVSSALGRQGRIRVVGTSDIPHAVERIAQLHPDIVLFEARRPDSLDHAKALTAAQPAAKVVAFGVPENDHEILALAATGIAGYVREDAAAEDAIAVLAGVMRDELLCSPRTAASLYHQVALLSQNGGDSPGPTLSPREFQIAHLIERGLSNKQIARQLKIEATTVKNHVHNILDKLNVHRRGEAAARIRAELKLRHPADAQALAPSATNNG